MKRIITTLTCPLILALVACVPQDSAEKTIKSVSYAGYHTPVTGQLSDGTKFTGDSWYQGGAKGKFCLVADALVCSGSYPADSRLIIKGTMSCTNQTTGSFTVKRVTEGDFVTPIHGKGQFSDGRTASVTFGPMSKARGKTTCFN